jgi:linoleoyl-CoA desaturase
MKTIQFKSTDRKEKEFVDQLKMEISDYFKKHNLSIKGNFWLFLKAIVILSVYIVPWIMLIILPLNGWIAVLLCILIGIGEAGVGMNVMHDAAHGSLSRKKWVNNLFQSSMYILGSNIFNWKIQHNLFHHTYTNIYGFDPDIGTKLVIRLNDHSKIRSYHKYQYFYSFFLYGLMTLSKIVLDVVQLFQYNKSGLTKQQKANPRKEMAILLVSKTLYFLVFIGVPLWLSSFLWWEIVIGFIIVHFTAGIIMSTVFQMAHVVEGAKQPLPDASGTIPHEWMVHQLHCTSDFAPKNRILGWYIGGLNYQIEHHLFPNISHIHYRKIAPIVQTTATKFGIFYNVKPTFVSALSSHINRLKELGSEEYKNKDTEAIKTPI